MMNHYFDENGVYTASADANPGSLPPDNAIRIAPPQCIGYWPVIKPARDGWDMLEDHRGLDGWLNREKHTIAELGPYPEGWNDTPPAIEDTRTPEEIRRAEILYRLDAIDSLSVRPLRAINNNPLSDTDRAKLVELEAEAEALREELQSLA